MEKLNVTVIVPVHNMADTVGRALDSVARQTRQPARVIVVDDASQDDSAAIARRSAVADLEVLELTRNVGAGAARNAGAAASATEWLAFLDSDDAWEPTFLDDVLGAAVSLEADFASSGGVREMVRRPPIYRLVKGPPAAADRSSDFWRIARKFFPIVPTSAVIRRDAYFRARGFEEDVRWGEDVPLFARLWLNGRFAFVNRPLYASSQRPTGLSAAAHSYREIALYLARMGSVLVRAIVRRKPGTGALAREFARKIYRKHRSWFGGRFRRLRRRFA